MISLSIILCPFIHNSTVARQQHKHHFSEISANNCFQFWLSGTSLCAIVDFVALEVFNSNNPLSEALVGLQQFYPKSFLKQFCAFLRAPNFILYNFVAAKLMRNLKVIYETISEAVVALNLFYPKSFQKQFHAFLKAPEVSTLRSHKTYAIEFNLYDQG